jgi:hypothetical protein
MKLEVGKTYKRHDGVKVRIICTDRKDPFYPCVGLMQNVGASDVALYYTKDGKHASDVRMADIYLKENKIELDWSAIPPWLNWFAVDSNGDQFFYQIRPESCSSGWWIAKGGYTMEVAKEFRYKVNCDWKDTLTERPKK